MALYAFDGTWNDEKDAGEYGLNTNVRKFYDYYADPKKQYYTKGVGTKHGRLGKIFGGAFGVGGRARTKDAYGELCNRYAGGDRDIDVIGFSRGAALALNFVHYVSKKGIRDPETSKVIDSEPCVRFLGLWDVVASFGIPIDLGPIKFQRINLGYKLSLHSCVEYAFQAIALDERRQAFRVTRVENAYEVWFRGVHSDVGGGNGNTQLSDISLRWMLTKAAAAGLQIDREKMNQLAGDASADLREPRDFIRNRPRELRDDDLVHHTVTVREGDRFNNPRPESPRETPQTETTARPVSKAE